MVTLFKQILVALSLLWLSSQPAFAAPKLEQIGPALNHPWGMDFLSKSEMLVSERRGKLYRINLNNGSFETITNPPEVVAIQQGGLLDVLVDGDFVYLCYSKPQEAGIVTAIDKSLLDGTELKDTITVFQSNNTNSRTLHYGCRLAMHDGTLYASLGDRGSRDNAQDPSLHDGSIIALREDGAAANNISGWLPEILSIGHRNPQGLAIHPDTHDLWAHEHGPQGGDEINIIARGGNYGWPVVSHGSEYGSGDPVSQYQSLSGYVDPSWVWIPSIAPSGMAFYPAENGEVMFDDLQGGLLVGSLKFRRLYAISLEKDGLPSAERVLVDRAIGRIRDVAVGPDGAIWLLNDAKAKSNPPAGLYRISQ